jgi:uncharacterized protein (TIGR02147 family)
VVLPGKLGYILNICAKRKGLLLDLNLFEYSDYRSFLRDFYKYEKKRNPKFSHRYIAQKVGFTSSSFFSQIIKVQSNITPRLAINFARLMKLNKTETEYFQLLVQYNQAKSHEETKYFYEKILSFRRPKIKKIEANQYKLLNKWYNIAIRQILGILPFKGDYKQLAKTVEPAIKPNDAKKAIQLLMDLGLIKKDAQGYHKSTDPSITTGEKSNAVGVQSYLLETLELARQAIDRFPQNKRKMSTLTLSISETGLKAMEERLQTFRKELLEIAENDDNVDRVYQLNLQFFPMSKIVKGGYNE